MTDIVTISSDDESSVYSVLEEENDEESGEDVLSDSDTYDYLSSDEDQVETKTRKKDLVRKDQEIPSSSEDERSRSLDETEDISSGDDEDSGLIPIIKEIDSVYEDSENDDQPKDKPSSKTEKLKDVDEYEQDSSDEEDLRNTIGNVPLHWYNEYPHLGYDWDAEKIIKPIQGDELDEFMKKMDDPNYWRTVRDPSTGQDVILTNEDLELINNIQKGRYPDGNFDPYQPFEDFFTYKTMIHPVTNRPEHKRSFIPSKVEKEKVSRLVHAMKMGWMKVDPPKKEAKKFFPLWDDENENDISNRMQRYIPAPKLKLPGHEESYNPPPEYLMTPDELKKWQNTDRELRKINFIPQKFSSLRLVPGYKHFTEERFARCLDLYLCPRQIKMKVNVDPEDLIPKLPKPRDLQPFPTVLAIIYEGHTDMVRSISFEPSGQLFASGGNDKSVRIWEVLTGRCLKVIKFDEIVRCIAWCPNATINLLAVASGNFVYIVNPGLGSKTTILETDIALQAVSDSIDLNEKTEEKVTSKTSAVWKTTLLNDKSFHLGFRISIEHFSLVEQVTWQTKGDYLASVTTANTNQVVFVHRLTSRKSQAPFQKTNGLVQKVLFHPSRPYFFVATQQHVRIYNLLKEAQIKKLLCNCKWLSSMAIHPNGDNVIIGSFDCRLTWFDLDLSVKPYKTLRHHKKAIRQVTFHRKYPLFASASDDASVIISHGMVYNDLLQNPLLVPVKILKGHKVNNDMGVLDCQFHPLQPWLLSSGADSKIHLYT